MKKKAYDRFFSHFSVFGETVKELVVRLWSTRGSAI